MMMVLMMCMGCAVSFTNTNAHDTTVPCTATGPFYSMSETEVERMFEEDAKEARRIHSMRPPIPGFRAGYMDEGEIGQDSWQLYYQAQDLTQPDPLNLDTKAHTPPTPHKTRQIHAAPPLPHPNHSSCSDGPRHQVRTRPPRRRHLRA